MPFSGPLEAVIGLPANPFYSTSIPACLLILGSTKPAERRGAVLFVDGSKRFTNGRNQNARRDEDVESMFAGYRAGVDPDGDGGARSADVVDVATALAEPREAQAALREAEARLDERLAETGHR